MAKCHKCGKTGASNQQTITSDDSERFEKQFSEEVTILLCDECNE